MKKKHIKDPGSAITHFIGMLMAIFAAFPLLIKAAHEPSRIYLISLAIYAVSLILLYAASTTYHTFDNNSGDCDTPYKCKHDKSGSAFQYQQAQPTIPLIFPNVSTRS